MAKQKKQQAANTLSQELARLRRLIHGGNITKATVLGKKLYQQHPTNTDVIANLANTYSAQHNYYDALTLIESSLALVNLSADFYLAYARALRGLLHIDKALVAYEQALAINPANSIAQLEFIDLVLESGETNAALAYLNSALKALPDNVELLNKAAFLANQLGYYEKALNYCRKVVSLTPTNAEALFRLGLSFQAASMHSDAINAYQDALHFMPHNTVLLAHLAQALEKSNRLDEAKQIATKVLKTDPRSELATMVLATLARREGQLDQAMQYLQNVLTTTRSPLLTARAHTEMGKLFDQLEQYQQAYTNFDQANTTCKQLPEYSLIDSRILFTHIDAYLDSKTTSLTTRQNNILDDGLNTPIFLVGFPRSGTTLTEQILACHPNLCSGDEQAIISHMIYELERILHRPVKVPTELSSLSATELSQLRQYYWSCVRALRGDTLLTQRYIDKMPFNIIHLGFIAYLFPSAQILVAIRDPRDACLSSFMQLFTLNEATIHCLSIADTAHLYSKVMQLWLYYRESLEINWHEFHYEDLVSQFTPTTNAILRFLNEPPSDKLQTFYTVTQQSVSTPSYEDVVTPLYTRAVGRWHHYSTYLEPVLAELNPFITKLNYSVSEH